MQVFSFLKKAMGAKGIIVMAMVASFVFVLGVQEGSAQSIKHQGSLVGATIKSSFANKTTLAPDDARAALLAAANDLRQTPPQNLSGSLEALTMLRINYYGAIYDAITAGTPVDQAVLSEYSGTLVRQASNYNQSVVTPAHVKAIFNNAVDLVTL